MTLVASRSHFTISIDHKFVNCSQINMTVKLCSLSVLHCRIDSKPSGRHCDTANLQLPITVRHSGIPWSQRHSRRAGWASVSLYKKLNGLWLRKGDPTKTGFPCGFWQTLQIWPLCCVCSMRNRVFLALPFCLAARAISRNPVHTLKAKSVIHNVICYL